MFDSIFFAKYQYPQFHVFYVFSVRQIEWKAMTKDILLMRPDDEGGFLFLKCGAWHRSCFQKRKKFYDNCPKMLKQMHSISRLPVSLEPLPIGQTIPQVSSGQFRRTGSCWKFCTVIGLQLDILLSFHLNAVGFNIEITPKERMLMTMHITSCFCHRLSLLTY